MKFSNKITVLFTLLYLIGSSIVVFSVYKVSIEPLEKVTRDHLELGAFHTMDKIDRMIQERHVDLLNLSSDPIIMTRTSTAEQIAEKLRRFKNERRGYESFSFFDLNRVRIADTSGNRIGQQSKLEDYWIDLAASKDFVVDIHMSSSLQRPAFHFATVVRDRYGKPLGVVVSRFTTEVLDRLLKSVMSTISYDGLTVHLVDKKGLILYSNVRSDKVLEEISPDWETMNLSLDKREKTGSVIYTNPKGKIGEEVFVFARQQGYLDFKGSDWTLNMFMPSNVAFASARELKNKVIVILMFTGSILFVFISLLANRVSGPISRLSDAAKEIGKGNLDIKVKVTSGDEVGRLSEAFNKMAADLKIAKNIQHSYSRDLELRIAESTGDLRILNEKLEHDVAQRIKTEENLHEANDRLNAILQASPAAIYIVNPEGVVTMWNKAAEQMFGWSEEEAVGQRLPIVTSDTYQDFQALIERLLSGTSISGLELRRHKRDGASIDISVSAAPLYAPSGEANAIMAIATDITLRRKMEEELLKKEKLESLGVLAGGIAHDFNNLLTAILGNISLAKMFSDPSGKEFQRLVEAEKASVRAKDLTQQLLTFSRGGEPIKKVISIAPVLEESVSFALRGSRTRGQIDVAEGLWAIEADEGQVSQVFHNLIINADQAMPQGGVVKITGENVIIDTDQTAFLKQGNYVRISIEDQGIGIPEEYLEKIFDPYFTTKQQGTGLGLASAYSVVKKHEGHIQATSELGTGTNFHIYLPASEKVIRSRDKREEHTLAGKGRILIMDDEEMVREVACEMLKNLGYEIEQSKDGSDAIERYRTAKESGQPFDIVIMDLTVPGGMGGEEAIKELIEIDPQVKAIVSSGYSNDPIMASFSRHGFKGVITKPYKLNEMGETVHNVMSS